MGWLSWRICLITGVRSVSLKVSGGVHHGEIFLGNGEMAGNHNEIEKWLLDAEYSVPVLGLIFLRYVILSEICLRSLSDLLRVFTKKARKG